LLYGAILRPSATFINTHKGGWRGELGAVAVQEVAGVTVH
jgi:hypothetical protein